MTLTLTTELERRLAQEAGRRGMTVEQYALEVLTQSLPVDGGHEPLGALLQSWIDEASEEPQGGDDLYAALDEDRLSDRRLFPPELKGVTW